MHRARKRITALVAATLAVALHSGCRRADGSLASDAEVSRLRIGVGGFTSTGNDGLRPLAQLLTVENLARLSDDGRPQPWLAKDWNVSPDGRTLTVNLLSGITFHDGSPLTAQIVANTLEATLPSIMGPAFSDVESVAAASDQQIVIRLRQPSPFLLDALEVPVPKPGTSLVGTGPFSVDDPQSPTEMRANEHYSQGRPSITRIVVKNYPSVRAAWAELLRGQLDMLYEVGGEALDSLEASNQISTFTFVRRYQYAVVLNRQSDVFRSKSVRRALNIAVDRGAIVRDALNSHGVVSSGPVWPHNYGLRPGLPQFTYDTKQASEILAGVERGHPARLHFTCLVRPDALTERIALVLKRQLAEVGVDMAIEETPLDDFINQVRGKKFEAALTEVISGPSLLRPYRLWHSNGYFNTQSAAIDDALDRVRYSASLEDYQNAVGGFQQAMMDDPPAIFLAWSERARAVSKRFIVPTPESGRDILGTLRLWTSRSDEKFANRN